MAAGAASAAITFIIVSREDAGQMLLEADAGFFRNAGGVGIDSPEKPLDFLLSIPLDNADVRIARWRYIPWLDLILLDLVWLDLILHLQLHPCHPRSGDPHSRCEHIGDG
jgi:hypothetical protein